MTPILSADQDTKAPEPNTKASGRVEAAGTVLDEIQAAPDNRIPEEVLGSADCVAVVPSLLNGGFVFGARYGKGVASCRTEKGWSAPAFFTIGGGSFGLQIGGQATDVVMLIMNKNGMDNLLSSQCRRRPRRPPRLGRHGLENEGGGSDLFPLSGTLRRTRTLRRRN
jgi:lipid-binding SYLF domain-containing protein